MPTKIWGAKWPNGDVTLVAAGSKAEALRTLDDLGDVTDLHVSELRGPLVVDYKPCGPKRGHFSAYAAEMDDATLDALIDAGVLT